VPEVPGVPGVPAVPEVPGAYPSVSSSPIPPIPATLGAAFEPVARLIRLAVSAAKADGTLSDTERTLIMDRAREAELETLVEQELAATTPLAEIVRGVTDPAMKNELYVLAFTIIRADENVSGAERIYLAQLAHQLGLDPASTQALELDTAHRIDSQTDN
jgi:uncharacterized membrane protein YebE (DUF533 family)